jgi:hypothetical protein
LYEASTQGLAKLFWMRSRAEASQLGFSITIKQNIETGFPDDTWSSGPTIVSGNYRNSQTGEADPNFQKTFVTQRRETLPEWVDRSRFNYFYRLAVNTRVPDSEAGKIICIGVDTPYVRSPPLRFARSNRHKSNYCRKGDRSSRNRLK